jgi:hypothetical protein
MARVNVRADLATVERGMEQAVRDARPTEGETNFKGWVRLAYTKIRELRRKGISWQAIADVLRDQTICHPGGKSMSTGTLIQYMAEIRRESAEQSPPAPPKVRISICPFGSRHLWPLRSSKRPLFS